VSIDDRLRAVRVFDPSRFARFMVGGELLGHVRRDFLPHLDQFAEVFSITDSVVALRPGLDAEEDRSAAMADVARTLAARGLLSRWRNETYDITSGEGEPRKFVLERAAVRFFGCRARAVHINGLTVGSGTERMWIARRAGDKAIDPGMLDNMVGGGLARGLSIEATVIKESWEEAGIPAELASRARRTGTVGIRREVPDGLHFETIYAFELVLPDNFTPTNQDGEVAEFRAMPLADVLQALAGDAPFTADAGMVALHCLSRKGLVPEL
jgi:8-oxo-dGTP pyrophosphatase MutT (NUDIX family)